MTHEEYDRFTDRLQANLIADPRALALVALGSMALSGRRDAFSDHDFWVVVRPGAKKELLDDLSWLPDAKQVVATIRPWEHYGTVLYPDGHVVEFGVFEPDQLSAGNLGAYCVLFDRYGIDAKLAEVAAASVSRPTPAQERWSFEEGDTSGGAIWLRMDRIPGAALRLLDDAKPGCGAGHGQRPGGGNGGSRCPTDDAAGRTRARSGRDGGGRERDPPRSPRRRCHRRPRARGGVRRPRLLHRRTAVRRALAPLSLVER